jgi:hypothetical protein
LGPQSRLPSMSKRSFMRTIADLLQVGAERQNEFVDAGRQTRVNIAGFLKVRSIALCHMVSRAFGSDKSSEHLTGKDADRAVIGRYSIVVDCLARFFDLSDERFFDIVVGEVLKMTHRPELTEEELCTRRLHVASAISDGMLKEAVGSLSATDLDALEAELGRIHNVVTAPVRKTLDLGCVGDC